MRQFVIWILALTATSTVLAMILGHQLRNLPPAKPSSDAGDLNWHCYEEPLKLTTKVSVRGWAHLCLGERSVKVVVDAESLNPGDIYTTWLAYVDAPGSCTATPCPLHEFTRLDYPATLSKLDAAIVDDTRRATFTSTMRYLSFVQGSQVQLLLVTHGTASVRDRRAHQILGARWPDPLQDAPGPDGVIARSHFTMLSPLD